MNMITANDIRNIIIAGMEPDLADKILEVLQPFNGKNITTRIETALNDALGTPELAFRIVRHYGWTDISWKGSEHNIIIARSEKSVPLDIEWVKKENPAHFSARVERNTKRTVLMQDYEWMKRTAVAINTLNSAYTDLQALLEWDNPIRYSLQDQLNEALRELRF